MSVTWLWVTYQTKESPLFAYLRLRIEPALLTRSCVARIACVAQSEVSSTECRLWVERLPWPPNCGCGVPFSTPTPSVLRLIPIIRRGHVCTWSSRGRRPVIFVSRRPFIQVRLVYTPTFDVLDRRCWRLIVWRTQASRVVGNWHRLPGSFRP